jgi:hypothetical protein
MRAYSPPGSGRRKGLVDWAGVATVNSFWELAVGSSSKEKPTVTKAVTVARYTRRRKVRSTISEGL